MQMADNGFNINLALDFKTVIVIAIIIWIFE